MAATAEVQPCIYAAGGGDAVTAGIRRIRAINYRCLRDVDVELDQFHVLVGANGSGKSALFDAFLFARDLLSFGLDSAVEERTSDFRDLVWGRPDDDLAFKLAFELDVPDEMREEVPKSFERIAVSLSVQEARDGLRATLNASPKRNGNARSIHSRWKTQVTFGPETSFEAAVKFENPLVSRHVERAFREINDVVLDSLSLRQASPRIVLPRLTSGHALPVLIRRLKKHRTRFAEWKKHIRTALGDVTDIRVRTREDDRRSYLVVVYGGGLEVPSWALSDGTLRLLALTIVAFLPENGSTYLVEEPENGIHPLAVEAVYRSLSSSYDAQVLVATHSPVFLACTEPCELLCFSKRDGETQITRGDRHPHLKHWQSAADVDLLFASDVLG